MNEDTLFAAALEKKDPSERAAFLDHACGDDTDLRERIESKLRQLHEASDSSFSPTTLESTRATDQEGASLPRTSAASQNASFTLRETSDACIGPYRLLEKLGEGGMGVVWRAEQAEPVKRQVALKVIKAGLDSAHVLARFETERQVLARMDHPGIAKVLDAGTTPEGRPYFVMELVDGVAITKYCDRQNLTPRERLELFVPVCQAVQHAHQKGVIHRDLKPSNVLVTLYDGKPTPKVIDFGIAKAAGGNPDERTVVTEIGQIVGTLEYMAPEQAELNNLDIDTRADIYSLGVLLYELLTGSPPFTGRQLRNLAFTEMLRTIREVEPPKPSTRVSASTESGNVAAKRKLEPKRLTKLLRGELDWIVMKCLEKDRSRRYETANGLALDVRRYLANEPVQAGPPSTSYRLRKFVRRNRGPVLAAALVLLALVGGIVGTSLGLLEARRQRDEVDRQRQSAEDNAARALRAESDARDKAHEAEVNKTFAEANAKQARANMAQALEQESQARRAQAEMRTVLSFFQDKVLAAARPKDQAGGLGIQASIRAAVDAAVPKVGETFKNQPLVEAEVRNVVGQTYQYLGEYRLAIAQLERAQQLRQAVLGAHHPDTLVSLSSLAQAYQAASRYNEALPLLETVLKQRQLLLGDKHPDTLMSMNNLAQIHQALGRSKEALPLMKNAFEGMAQQLGPDAPDTLQAMNNLAHAYQSVGRLKDAHTLLKKTFERQKATLGPDHPDTILSMTNLGQGYQESGQIKEALPLLEESLRRRKAALGLNHPQTLTSMQNLGNAYYRDGRIQEALEMLEDALKRAKTELGPDHSQTLVGMNNLAGNYLDVGRIDEALGLFREALKVQKTMLGVDHPHTLMSMHNLASTYLELSRIKDALPLFEEVVEREKAALGPDHPQTLNTMQNLARTYEEAGRHKDAIALMEETLKRKKMAQGVDHPNTLSTMNALGNVYCNTGQLKKAVPLLEETLDRKKDKLGPDHPDTLTAMNDLGYAYHVAGRVDEALSLFEETLKGRQAKLGADHPETLRSMSNLATAYFGAGRRKEALPLLEEALKLKKAKFGPDHVDTLLGMNNLAQAYQLIGRMNDAIPLQESAVAGAKSRLGSAHPYTLHFTSHLADLYDSQRQFDKSEPLRRDFAELLRKNAETDPVTYASSLAVLGLNLLEQKKFADAETTLRECLTLRTKKQPDDWSTFNVRSMLGSSLAGQKKYAEAEPLLLQGYEGMKERADKIPPAGKVRLLEGMERLARLYDAWDKKDKADEWHKKLDAAKKALK